MKRVPIHAVVLALAAFGGIAGARADIYGYVDSQGEMHLTNNPTADHYEVWSQSQPASVAPAAADQAAAPSAPDSLANMRARYHPLVQEVAKANELEPALLHAVISVESGYNPRAKSRKGASGLMQLMPGTARRYGVADIFDPAQNVAAGARYLRDLLRMFNNDKNLALAAYNAGENAVVRHGKIPPYQETVAYVPKVLAFYRRLGNAKLDS